MKKDKNEELQSRREFFKSAAKAALPIIGAAVLASAPTILQATETTACGVGSCKGTCFSGCEGCSWSCEGTCSGGCSGSCKNSCSGSCRTSSR